MSLSPEPNQKKRLLPGALAITKLRFLYLEAMGDLFANMWGSLDFYITIFVFLFAFWLRIYFHYLGQYFMLISVSTPVYCFELQGLQISFKYMSAAIPQAFEVGLIAVGPLVNILCFVIFSLLGGLFYKLAGFLPEGGSKIILIFIILFY